MPIIPGQEQVDEAMQVRQRRKFFEEAKALALLKLQPNEVSEEFKYLKQQQFNWKDEKLEFNNNMERAIPFSFKAEEIQQSDFAEIVIERGSLGTDKLGAISTDKILEAINEAIQITGTLAASTTLNNGDQGVMTVTLDDTADPNRVMFGVAHITAFHTTVAGANIIPYGSSETPANWLWANKADWNSNNNKKSTWIDYIRNVAAGASQSVLWRLHFRYIGQRAKDS